MTPDQFLQRIGKSSPAPAYLFLGPEAYGRRLCLDALTTSVLQQFPGTDGLTHFDLEEISLQNVLDDARSLSLFAPARLIRVTSAELALPRRMTSSGDTEGEERPGSEAALADYLKAPTPNTVVVLECSRYDFSGDDRAKLDRVAKFYAKVPAVVEFRPYTLEGARILAQQLAKEHGLQIRNPKLTLLLDAVAGDANRLAGEMEKLALYVGKDRAVSREDLQLLVPNAAQSTIFGLVNALGKGDRAQALRSLDILIRDGEYLPLALTFLSTQFRLALAAKEAKLQSPQQALSYFGKLGVRMWPDRAQQVAATAGAFSQKHLANAVSQIYETDKKFREGYRDDRVVMETLIFAMTS